MYSWVCFLSVPHDVLQLKFWEFIFQTPDGSYLLLLWPPGLTREGNKCVHYIRGLQKVLRNPCFRKQGATLDNVMLCYQENFVPINSVIKIHADSCRWSGYFCLVFFIFFHLFLQFECITAINCLHSTSERSKESITNF